MMIDSPHPRAHLRFFLAAAVFASLLLPAAVFAAFSPSNKPIALTGYKSSIRTVWFSPDGQLVYGDYDHLVKWNLKTGELLSSIPIPGYNVHPSLISEDGSFWMQGNLGYDDPARPDIGSTHATLTQGGPDGPLKTKKTGKAHFSRGVFLPGSHSAIFVVSENRRYSVRRYDPAQGTLLTTYLAPAKPRSRVPTTLAVDRRGEVLAVGQGGGASGVALFNVKTGTRLHMYKTNAEITALSFVGDDLFFSDLDGRIYRWAPGTKSAKLIMKSPKRIMNMAVHPSGTSAIIGSMRGVYLLDLNKKTVERRLLKSRAMDIRFSADGDKVAIALQKTLHLPKTPSVYVFENTHR